MNLALDTLTFSEKMQAMEQLWANLSQTAEQDITPKWHGEVLNERLRAVENGQGEFIDWKIAKEQLRASVQ